MSRKAELMRLGVLDSASTKDLPVAKPETDSDLFETACASFPGAPIGLSIIIPSGVTRRTSAAVSPTQLTLGPAWEDAKPEGIGMILSGHVHLFEFLALEDAAAPINLIAGDSGTELDTGITLRPLRQQREWSAREGGRRQHELRPYKN